MSLVDQIKTDLASAHVRQQAGRFVRLTAIAFGAQLAAIGTGHLDRSALIGAAVGAVEAAYRQWAPVVPWTALAERLHLLGAVQAAAVPPVPPAVVTPPTPAPVVAPAVAPAVTDAPPASGV